MFGGKPVLAIAVVFSVLLCAAPRSHVSKASTTPIEGLTVCQGLPSSTRLLSPRPQRPRNVSQFSQFRYRMKSVLVETTDTAADEPDLGPAILPSRLISVSPLELASRRLAAVYPLRC